MLSKKNIQGRLRKVEPTEQRFSIRKFTVGAASVLIGMAFMGMSSGQTAHAATTEQNPVVETNKTDSSSTAEKLETAKADAVKSAATDQTGKSAETEKATSSSSANESEAASNNINSTASQNNVVKSDNNTAASQSKATETKALTTKAKSDAATPVEKATQNQNGGVASSAASTNSAAPASTAKVGSASADSTAKASAKKSVVPTGDEAAKLAEKYGKKIVATDTSSTKDTTEYKNSEDASDWESFINALNNANTDHINITQDITVTGKATGTTVSQKVLYGGRQALSGKDIARTVTISGNDHTVDFTNQALDLTDANQGDNNDAWNITLENVTIKADELKAAKSQTDYASYSPISLTKVSAKNQAKDTITFKNVTADVTGRPVITGMTTNSAGAANTGYEKYTLVLEGNNNLTSTAYTGGLTPGDDGDAISAGYIIVKNGTTTINMPQTTKYNLQYGGAAVRANADFEQDETTGEFTKYPVDVQEGATLNITGGDNVKGIVAIGTDEQLRGGAVNIDGNVNMNMGSGHSIAVYSGNLVVGKTGNLDVTTAMSSNTGTLGSIANYNSPGWGVLSIGVGKAGSAAIDNTSSVLEDNGVIKVVRTSTDKGYNPMISMGSGASSGNNTKTININEGATLDLQDNTQQTNEGMIFINGWVGGAAGSGLKGYINFNSPEYVNLQRLNPNLPSNGGAFIYNERQNQNTAITSSPVAQWDAANLTDTPNYTWMITSSSSRGRMGSNADGFAPIGFDSSKVIVPDAASSYLTSNGSVIMAPTQGDGQYDGSQKASANTDQGRIIGNQYPYLNQFLNNFSWWTPQRIAMGTKLLETDSPVKSKDNDLYEPEVQTIDGTTNQTLSDLNPQDGIKDILKTTVTKGDNGENELSSAVDSDVKYTIAWYNPTDDATEWKDVMGDKAAPENPTGNLKTTDKSAWAKITYSDGTVDFANIPLNITEPDTTIYQPEYKDSKGTQGKDVEIPVNYPSDANDKSINPNNKAPEGTKYALGKDAPTGATIDPSTGTITYDIPADQPVGDVSIPVTVSYPDGTSDSVTAKVTVDPSDKNEYQPSYKPVDVKKGGSVTTGAPTYTNTDGKDVTAPEGTKYSIPEGTKLPEGVKASVGSDGKVTVQTSDNTPEGPIEIPVTVTYPDGSSETVNAPIIVGGTTFVGTDYTVTSYADLKNLHETSDNSMYPDPKSVITKVVYWNNKDLAAGKNLEGTEADLNSGVTFEWTKAPNTVVSQASMSATLPGTGTPTVSSTNPALKISFANDSQLVQQVGKYLNLNDEYGWSQTIQWYGDPVIMQGAAPVDDAASKKLEVTPAKVGDKLTDAEVSLINQDNLNKLTANKPKSYTWANDLKAGDTQGTVKITFSDTDKDGNPTYLNVVLPAGSLNVKEPEADTSTVTINYVNNDDHSDIVKSTPVTGKVGAETGITQASINAGVPENWQVVGNQTLDVPTTFGSTDSTLTVYVEHKTETVPVDKSNKDTYREVTQTIISKAPTTGKETTVRTTTVSFQRTGVKDMVTGDITWNAWVGPEGSKTVNGQTTYEIPAYTITPVKGYDTYVNGVKNTDNQIPAVSVNADSSNITDTITYIAQNSTPVPYVPGTPGKNDDSNLYVTRTIEYTVPEGQKAIPAQTQTVHYVRKDAQGNSGYIDPATGKTQYVAWTLADGQTAEWPEANVNQIDGYDSLVDGTKAKTVAEQSVTSKTQDTTVNVTYTKSNEQGHTDTDAEKYTPSYKDVTGKPGDSVTSPVSYGKGENAPEGTTYKLGNNAPSGASVDSTTGTVTYDIPADQKDGSVTIPVVVTYPDGTSDTPTATVNVAKDTKVITPTNPTDPAQKDLFKTVTRTINIPTPNADGKTTDNSVTQTVTFGRTKTVNAKTGALISYSPYTVYNTDTNTLTNDSTGTFPEKDVPQVDGYTSEVDGKPATKVSANTNVTADTPSSTVNVTYAKNGEQGHTDTNADKYTPEGTTITVDEGHKLDNNDAADGIKNKDDMPKGTTYSWDPSDTPSTDTPGNKAGTVIVTYPDKSTDSVPVVVNVKSQAESYDPEGQDIHTTVGGDPQPVDGIKNSDDMPKGTTYTWTNKPDTSKPGTVSTVVNVIYPDHSVDQVPVKVIIGNPSDNTNKTTDADNNDPQGQTVNTTIGVLPDPVNGIKNSDDMPQGTTYTWSGTPDVYTKGSHPGVVKVTYPDNSVDYVPVTVNVTNEPTGKPTTIEQDGQVPDPNTVVDWGNGKEPSNTTITWEKQPDPSKPGDQQGTVKITYPTGQTTTVVVPVTVTPKNPSADDFDPTAKSLDLPYGATVPAAKDQINPDSTNGYTITDAHWTTEPDTKKPGLQLAHISVTGTKDGKSVTKDVPVYVHVGTEADSYDPKGQDFSTPLNSDPAATEGISNISDLPSTAKITWSLAPDTSTTGVKPSLIKVTYSDGSVTYVPVNVTVTDNNGGNTGDNGNSGNVTTDPTPIPQDIHTPKGVVPDPEDGIKNKGDMPDGTKYTWKETPDVSTEGTHTGVISVNYPDGSSVDVPVTVIVGSNNTNAGDNNKDTKPEPQPITTDQGELPDPSDGIKNKDDMPNGTTYTWKKTPDVSKTGTHKVTIVVTYPDGKTAEVTTTITVVKAGSEAGTTTGNGSGNNGNGSTNMNGNNGSGNNSGVATETGAVAGTNSTEANSANGNGTAKAATNNSEEGKLPQTGASDSSKTGIFGLALAAIAGLFGIAGDRKRKNN